VSIEKARHISASIGIWTLFIFSANESAPLDDMPSWACEVGFSRARHDILECVALLRQIPISPGDDAMGRGGCRRGCGAHGWHFRTLHCTVAKVFFIVFIEHSNIFLSEGSHSGRVPLICSILKTVNLNKVCYSTRTQV